MRRTPPVRQLRVIHLRGLMPFIRFWKRRPCPTKHSVACTGRARPARHRRHGHQGSPTPRARRACPGCLASEQSWNWRHPSLHSDQCMPPELATNSQHTLLHSAGCMRLQARPTRTWARRTACARTVGRGPMPDRANCRSSSPKTPRCRRSSAMRPGPQAPGPRFVGPWPRGRERSSLGPARSQSTDMHRRAIGSSR